MYLLTVDKQKGVYAKDSDVVGIVVNNEGMSLKDIIQDDAFLKDNNFGLYLVKEGDNFFPRYEDSLNKLSGVQLIPVSASELVIGYKQRVIDKNDNVLLKQIESILQKINLDVRDFDRMVRDYYNLTAMFNKENNVDFNYFKNKTLNSNSTAVNSSYEFILKILEETYKDSSSDVIVTEDFTTVVTKPTDEIYFKVPDYETLTKALNQGDSSYINIPLFNVIGPFKIYNGDGTARTDASMPLKYSELLTSRDWKEKIKLQEYKVQNINGLQVTIPLSFIEGSEEVSDEIFDNEKKYFDSLITLAKECLIGDAFTLSLSTLAKDGLDLSDRLPNYNEVKLKSLKELDLKLETFGITIDYLESVNFKSPTFIAYMEWLINQALLISRPHTGLVKFPSGFHDENFLLGDDRKKFLEDFSKQKSKAKQEANREGRLFDEDDFEEEYYDSDRFFNADVVKALFGGKDLLKKVMEFLYKEGTVYSYIEAYLKLLRFNERKIKYLSIKETETRINLEDCVDSNLDVLTNIDDYVEDFEDGSNCFLQHIVYFNGYDEPHCKLFSKCGFDTGEKIDTAIVGVSLAKLINYKGQPSLVSYFMDLPTLINTLKSDDSQFSVLGLTYDKLTDKFNISLNGSLGDTSKCEAINMLNIDRYFNDRTHNECNESIGKLIAEINKSNINYSNCNLYTALDSVCIYPLHELLEFAGKEGFEEVKKTVGRNIKSRLNYNIAFEYILAVKEASDKVKIGTKSSDVSYDAICKTLNIWNTALVSDRAGVNENTFKGFSESETKVVGDIAPVGTHYKLMNGTTLLGYIIKLETNKLLVYSEFDYSQLDCSNSLTNEVGTLPFIGIANNIVKISSAKKVPRETILNLMIEFKSDSIKQIFLNLLKNV